MGKRARALGWIASAWLAASSAVAGVTTWEFQGTLTGRDAGSVWPADWAPGAPYRILVSFDPVDEGNVLRGATRQGNVGGNRYNWAVPSLTYAVWAGTTCAPCEPAKAPGFNPGASSIIVRDDFDDGADGNGNATGPVDGITFSLVTAEGNTVNLLMRGPQTDVISINSGAPTIPSAPDPRLIAFDPADGRTVVEFNVYDPCNRKDESSTCIDANLFGSIDALRYPSYGTNWFLSVRDCQFIDTHPWFQPAVPDAAPNNCIATNNFGQPRLGYGRVADNGGGAGQGEFVRTFAPPANPSWSGNPLGSAFAAVSFGGPSALPVVKSSSSPSDYSRNNGNAQAYQLYRYGGSAPAQLPLVVDLTYGVADYSDPADATAGSETGLRPGGANISAVLSIVDGDRVSIPTVAGTPFGAIACGEEPNLSQPDGSPWPSGSILGTVAFSTGDGQKTPNGAVQLSVTSCTQPGQPVTLAAGQQFIVATSMQTPSRGKWTQSTSQPIASGVADASHTLRVTFDPSAAPAVVQQIADSIAPSCTDCDFVPEKVAVAIDVQPGSTGCLNPTRNGVVPVAILGSEKFRVKDVRIDENLKLGSLAVRVKGGRPVCSISRVNADAYDDLMCQFDNASSYWQPGQTTATVTGKLANGLPFEGTDSICVK